MKKIRPLAFANWFKEIFSNTAVMKYMQRNSATVVSNGQNRRLELLSKKGFHINFAKFSEIYQKSHFAENVRITDFVSKRPRFYDGACTCIIFNYMASHNFIDTRT